MIRLTRYEFIKQFCKRSILALFVVFSLVNLFKIYGEYKTYSYLTDGNGERSWHTLHWQLYEEYRGEITPEKVERLLAVYVYYMTLRTEQYVDRVGSYNSTFTQASIVQLNTETFEKLFSIYSRVDG